MDIFSHGLWTGAVYKIANKKYQGGSRKPLNVKMAVGWGIFPDLFSFAIPVAWLLGNLVFGQLQFSDLPRPEAGEPPPTDRFWIFSLAAILYNLSHSAVIFALIFGLVWLIGRRPVFELGGWLLHILIDIPTHSYRFFPTPFLWPLSSFKFNGLSWGEPWFIALNYGTLLIVYLLLRRKKEPQE